MRLQRGRVGSEGGAIPLVPLYHLAFFPAGTLVLKADLRQTLCRQQPVPNKLTAHFERAAILKLECSPRQCWKLT
jgi:hypothetical protein